MKKESFILQEELVSVSKLNLPLKIELQSPLNRRIVIWNPYEIYLLQFDFNWSIFLKKAILLSIVLSGFKGLRKGEWIYLKTHLAIHLTIWKDSWRLKGVHPNWNLLELLERCLLQSIFLRVINFMNCYNTTLCNA